MNLVLVNNVDILILQIKSKLVICTKNFLKKNETKKVSAYFNEIPKDLNQVYYLHFLLNNSISYLIKFRLNLNLYRTK